MIAILDDDTATCQSLRRLLSSYGYETQAYTSVSAFLDSGCLRDAACLILDVQMPGQSGLDLQESLRAQGHRLPIIFITGHVDEKIRARAMNAGAVDMLEKPFDDRLFIDTIKGVLCTTKVL